MKIVMYSLLTLAFSALVFTPKVPEETQSKIELQNKRIISYKEERLKRITQSAEHQVIENNYEIQSLKTTDND